MSLVLGNAEWEEIPGQGILFYTPKMQAPGRENFCLFLPHLPFGFLYSSCLEHSLDTRRRGSHVETTSSEWIRQWEEGRVHVQLCPAGSPSAGLLVFVHCLLKSLFLAAVCLPK